MLKYCFIALALTATSPTFANPSAQPPSVAVSYADLDISRSVGRETLERRVASAISRVCGTPGGAHTSLSEKMRVRECRSQVRDRASATIEVAVAEVMQRPSRLSSR